MSFQILRWLVESVARSMCRLHGQPMCFNHFLLSPAPTPSLLCSTHSLLYCATTIGLLGCCAIVVVK